MRFAQHPLKLQIIGNAKATLGGFRRQGFVIAVAPTDITRDVVHGVDLGVDSQLTLITGTGIVRERFERRLGPRFVVARTILPMAVGTDRLRVFFV